MQPNIMLSITQKEREYANRKGIKTAFYDIPFAVGITAKDPILLEQADTSTLDVSIFRLSDGKTVTVTATRDVLGYENPKQHAPSELQPQIVNDLKRAESLLPLDIGINLDGLEKEEEIDQVRFQLTVGHQTYASVENNGGESGLTEGKYIAWPTKWVDPSTGQQFTDFLLPNDPSVLATLKLQVSKTPAPSAVK